VWNASTPVPLQVAEIQGERFCGKEVNRDGVARKGVDDEYVELLRRFALKGKSRVAQGHVDLGLESRRYVNSLRAISTHRGLIS